MRPRFQSVHATLLPPATRKKRNAPIRVHFYASDVCQEIWFTSSYVHSGPTLLNIFLSRSLTNVKARGLSKQYIDHSPLGVAGALERSSGDSNAVDRLALRPLVVHRFALPRNG